MQGLVEGERVRFARDASVARWLAAVLQPILILCVRRGIDLAMAENPGLDTMRLEESLCRLMEAAPGREPEP